MVQGQTCIGKRVTLVGVEGEMTGILLTIGLFAALLGTFTVIRKFGSAGPVRASVILLAMDAIAVFAAPI